MQAEVRHGDCLEVARELLSGSARLIYLDPPFLTQKTHSLRTRDRTREFSFDDIWASHEEYAKFLDPRLREFHRIVADDGSLFFHCDRKAAHIARALLDTIFGHDNFRSEIIWHYRRWSNSQRTLLPAHQTIFFYSKSARYVFNPIYGEYSPSTNVDQILQRRKRDEFGKATYERDQSGAVVTGDAKKGVPLSDVWDIPLLNPKARERTGYPTQKPVLLLERIITLVTAPGDLVIDPFCGSGTTLVAAQFTGRKALGIDSSEEAVELVRQRLANPEKTESPLLESGRESYRKVDDGALALLEGLDCIPVHRNNGIDAILAQNFNGQPVPVRVQRTHESALEAAAILASAGRTKNAALMVLVVTHRGGDLALGQSLPAGVIAVESPALQIREAISRYHDHHGQLSLKADA
jgi:site-specific DNA-methyltransferase (adenine-specific)